MVVIWIYLVIIGNLFMSEIKIPSYICTYGVVMKISFAAMITIGISSRSQYKRGKDH
jgi:hypothetical protein